MSTQQTSIVWQSLDVTGTEKLLLLAIADISNHQGDNIHPSNEYLEWLTGIPERTIQHYKAQWKQSGALIPVENESGGRGNFVRYRLDLSVFPQKEAWKKGATIAPLRDKGCNSEHERVQPLRQKGAIERMRNKEEPLEEPNTNTEPKPSARIPHGTTAHPSHHSKAQAQTRHSRIQEIVMSAYQDKNGVQCPWDGGEAKQLQSLLRATPNWTDQQVMDCINNFFNSDFFPTGSRPREWLGKLPKYLHKPLKREEPNGRSNSKAEQRVAQISATTRAVFTEARGISGNAAIGDENASGRSRTQHVEGNVKGFLLPSN